MTSTPLFGKQDKFTLKDGRSIGYLIAGNEKSNKTVVYSVANAACRYMAHTMSDKATYVGVRLVGVDRPGIGLTDPQTSPSLVDFAKDVIELMDHLGAERFSVVGESHALAIAHEANKLNKKVDAVGLLCSVGPPSTWESKDLNSTLQVGMLLSKWMPGLVGFFTNTMFKSKWNKAKEDTDYLIEFEKFVIKNDYGDKADLDYMSSIDRDTWITMGAGNVESFRQGPRGTMAYAALWSKPWGFELKDIEVPVYIYSGDEDTFMPKSIAEKMAGVLPQSTLHISMESAHLSTIFKLFEQALRAVTSDSS